MEYYGKMDKEQDRKERELLEKYGDAEIGDVVEKLHEALTPEKKKELARAGIEVHCFAVRDGYRYYDSRIGRIIYLN